ncbi:MAG: hypothetical protein ABI282_06715 [Candidatus Baltobacteraceae bacterium]
MSAPVLRMRDVTHVANGEIVVAATSLDVFADTQCAILRASAREAAMLAMLAAGQARPSSGAVLIGEYDPRVQPVHCKRIVGFVPHDPLPIAPSMFSRYIDYRAALWDIDARRARAHAALLLERLGGLHEAFAYPLVAALISSPELLVLDRPQLAHAPDILSVTGRVAIFSTHVDAACARAYTPFACEKRA